MKEDIKILEDKLKLNATTKFDWFGEKEFQALGNLINRNKELEEENKIIKGNYYTLCADIQMVTSELGFPEDTIIADEMVSMINENYIPVSLVEEKIEELKKYRDIAKELIEEKVVIADSDSLNYGRAEAHDKDIQVLQELLEKRK